MTDRHTTALQILQSASDLLAGETCDNSTACCRFAVTGREPWLTQVEWDLVKTELLRTGRRLPKLSASADGACPFLSGAGRCQVYAARPLGCRTFFCERRHSTAPLPKKALQALAPRLAALTVQTPGSDANARPIRSWLAGESGRRPAKGGRS